LSGVLLKLHNSHYRFIDVVCRRIQTSQAIEIKNMGAAAVRYAMVASSLNFETT
jgi:hypothetical protein